MDTPGSTKNEELNDLEIMEKIAQKMIKKAVAGGKERIQKVENSIKEENQKLDVSHNGDQSFRKSKAYFSLECDMDNYLSLNDVLYNWERLTGIIDPYHTKRSVFNAHMGDHWSQFNLKEDTTMEEAAKFVTDMLKHYNFSHRDSNLHDFVWTMHTPKTSKLFKLDDEIVFSNSVNHGDKSAIPFVNSLVMSIKKYLPKTLELSWVIREDITRDTDWVLIALSKADELDEKIFDK